MLPSRSARSCSGAATRSPSSRPSPGRHSPLALEAVSLAEGWRAARGGAVRRSALGARPLPRGGRLDSLRPGGRVVRALAHARARDLRAVKRQRWLWSARPFDPFDPFEPFEPLEPLLRAPVQAPGEIRPFGHELGSAEPPVDRAPAGRDQIGEEREGPRPARAARPRSGPQGRRAGGRAPRRGFRPAPCSPRRASPRPGPPRRRSCRPCPGGSRRPQARSRVAGRARATGSSAWPTDRG